MKNFYKRFGVITRLPFWRSYVRSSYTRGIDDAVELGAKPNFSSPDFTALLCGTSGEVTTDEFLKAVYKKSPQAKVIIIDLGEEQVESVRKLAKENYGAKNIEIRQANALSLDFIPSKSVDWIETDGFLAFFDEQSLFLLMEEWKRILKDNGFITLREYAPKTIIGRILNQLRIFTAKYSIETDLAKRSKDELERAFSEADFTFSCNAMLFPEFYRYCLMKDIT